MLNLLRFSAVCSLVLVGCSGGGENPRLASDAEEETERVSLLQAVRVVETATDKVVDLPASYVSYLVSLECGTVGFDAATMNTDDQWWFNHLGGFVPAGSACRAYAEAALTSRCFAEKLRGIAAESGAPITVGAYKSYAQSTETREIIEEMAARVEAFRLRNAAFAFSGTNYPSAVSQVSASSMVSPGACSPSDYDRTLSSLGAFPTATRRPPEVNSSFLQGNTFRKVMLDSFVGAAIEGPESIRRAYAHTLAVSEATSGADGDRYLVTTQAQSGVKLSRAAAAHLIFSGESDSRESSLTPLCTADQLSPQEQEALSVIRHSGISPAVVIDSALSIDQFLDGTLPGGSVRQRIAFVSGQTLDPSVAAHFGLRESDFIAARAYLADEVRAFSRSRTATAAWPTAPLGVGAYAYFVGVSPSPSVPDVYWSAWADERSLGKGWELSSNNVPTGAFLSPGSGSPAMQASLSRLSPSRTPSLAEFLGFAAQWAEGVVFGGGQTGYASRAGLVAPLSAAAPDSADLQGQIIYCASGTGTYPLMVGLRDNSIDHSRLWLVYGEDALRCALEGSIEGGACALSGDLSPTALTPNTSAGYVNTPGYSRFASGSMAAPSGSALRVYLLTSDSAAPAPGRYRAIAGFASERWVSTGCRTVHFGTELVRDVAAALEPNPEWCTRAKTPCGGKLLGDRIPLEDELNSDGDDVESSWQYYLAQARAASDTSDRLAVEYVNASTTLDATVVDQNDKVLAALEELQQVCGTSVDASALLKALTGGGSQLALVDVGACGAITDDATTCIGGRAIRGWKAFLRLNADGEFNKLGACIEAANATVPWAHLGGAGDAANTDYRVCGFASGGKVGPKDVWITRKTPTRSAEAECNADLQARGISSSNRVNLGADAGLGFFDTLAALPGAKEPGVCDEIRSLRKRFISGGDGPSSSEVIQRIIDSGGFSESSLRLSREALSLETEPGGFTSVLLNGQRLISLGTPETGFSSTWPCAASSAPRCAEGSGGLFCETTNCSSTSARTAYSERLIRAVAGALAMSFAGESLANGEDGMVQIEPSNTAPMGPFTLPVLLHNNIRILDGARSSVKARVGSSTVTLFGQRGPRGFLFENNAGTVPTSTELHRLFDRVFPITSSQDGSNYSLAWLKTGLDWRGKDEGAASNYAKFFGGLAAHGLSQGLLVTHLLSGKVFDSSTFNGVTRPHIGFRFAESELMNAWPECTILGGAPNPCLGGGGYGAANLAGARASAVGARRTWAKEYGFDFLASGPSYVGSRFGFEVGVEPVLGEFELQYTEQSVWDSLELLCEASVGEKSTDCSAEVVPVYGPADLPRVGNRMICAGDQILTQAALTLLQDFPKSAFQPLLDSGSVDSGAGTLNKFVSQLRTNLAAVADARPAIGAAVQGFGHQIRGLHEQLYRLGLQEQMAALKFQSDVANNITNCLTSIANSFTIAKWGGGAAAAAATCTNSIVQTRIAQRLNELDAGERQSELQDAILAFNQQSDVTARTLEEQRTILSQNLERVGESLGDIASEKAKAGRALNKALWYLSDEGTAVAGYSSARGLAKERYLRAHENAQRMAFLAKRAIEQRLGVELSQLREEMPLVEAPAGWESSVCKTSALDYDALKSTKGDDFRSFADQFIGDYVTKLENLVESYRQQFNFSSGADTAVLSLRDDVFRTRALCEMPGPNLLYHSDALYRAGYGAALENDWAITGCAGDLSTLGGCIQVLPASTKPFTDGSRANEPGYAVTLTNRAEVISGSAALVQRRTLPPGRYFFSFYVVAEQGVNPADYVLIRRSSGAAIPTVQGAGWLSDTPGPVWRRRHVEFELDQETDVDLGFKNASSIARTLTVAAPMLQAVGWDATVPGVYVPTTSTTNILSFSCADTGGDSFRERFQHSCEYLCENGYGQSCEGRGTRACFWEATVDISQRAIEAGKQFTAAGFARGNFNYRMKRVGANVVGTGVRDCSESSTPESCYGSGYVPISVYHQGPFIVRNHFGGEFRANLFQGTIEHARALSAERYISNPISSGDRDLIEQYMRTEFRGRPLDGHYVIRIWDEPGVDFNAIADVQLVMDYSYWSRND